ncbi:MAG: hypothetical protein P4L31_05615 [Candidatus Babeliales bacterium]|nr:hypothetical protein [Candidatus Babeliales bacterium]
MKNIKISMMLLLGMYGMSAYGMNVPGFTDEQYRQYQTAVNTCDANGNTPLAHALVSEDYSQYDRQKKCAG